MKRRPGLTRCRAFRPEGLEPRSLLAASVVTNVVENLGGVSRAAAIKGVEVTAPIAEGGSVTFRFEAEFAGHYTLLVRYTGEGLALKAQGPSGSAFITPGPPGPFATVHLPLEAATYEITATALGDRPVFVDWELLLDTGVGQGAAQASTLVGSAAGIPLPTPPGPPAPSASMTATVTPIVSFSMIAVGDPVGRADPNQTIAPVGPSVSGDSVALAFAGDGLPEGALAPPIQIDSEAEFLAQGELSPSMTLPIFGEVGLDEQALAFSSWVDRLAAALGTPPAPALASVEGDLVEPGGVDAVALASEPDRSERAGFAPELIAGVVVAVAIGRRWRPGLKLFSKRQTWPTMRSMRPLSMR